jgi:acetoin utilization deacetylase AcuC-like enzyme
MTTTYAIESAPNHHFGDHPENPDRLVLAQARLDSFGAVALPRRAATPEEVGRVHTPELIQAVADACRQGEAIIDLAPTYVTKSTLDDALRAAGATISCVQAVIQRQAHNAFAIVRPPGHHAEPDRSMGFCIFNNVAIGARVALESGMKRVAIVDYDAHHGNGTQAAFLDDERVAYLSTHQWGIYPGTGWLEDAAHARKRIVNVPLPAGAGDRAYARIADELITPFVTAVRPELILVSAGFDSHWADPLTSLGLASDGFHRLSRVLVQLANAYCSGRIVFVLEGGYNPASVADGISAVFAALLNREFIDPPDRSPYMEPDVGERLAAVIARHGF